MKNRVILLLVFVLMLPIRVNAFSGEIVIECDKKELKSGEITKCYIKCNNFDEEISSFHGKITLDSNLSLISTQKDAIWEGATDGGVIDLYTDKNKKGSFNIASFEIKTSNAEQSKIALNDIIVADSKFNEVTLPNKSTIINLSNNNSGDNSSGNNSSGNNSSGNNSSGNNSSQSHGGVSNDNVSNSPKTGLYYMWLVIILLIVSLIICFITGKKVINNE